MALLLKGALDAETKVGLKLNIQRKNLAGLLKNLPALASCAISSLSWKTGWLLRRSSTNISFANSSPH